jgi:DNA polymerase-2
MAVWVIAEDGERRRYFDGAGHLSDAPEPGARIATAQSPEAHPGGFRPAFYARGPLAALRSLGKELERRFPRLTAEITERGDLWSGKQVPVLAVTPPTLPAFPAVVRYVRRAAPFTDLYNADLLMEQLYCYERQVFPLAFCEWEAQGDRLVSLRSLDDPWETDFELPPLRILEISLDRLSGNPSHGGEFSLKLKVEDEVWVLSEADTGEPAARAFARLLTRHDPDLIVSEWGDSYLLPRLMRQAAERRIRLPLNRDPERDPYRKPDRSYFSYGRIVFKDSATTLFGRLHVDLRNSFVCGESGLEGLYELSRLTKLPLQYCARTSTGTGITSMQLDIVYREGILIPSQKAQPEVTKSGRELIVADRGGIVFHPKLGLYENVAELDFASMFPSIMARFNVSPETVNCGCCRNGKVPELGYSLCERRRGIVSRTVEPIIAKRQRYKALRRDASDPVRRAAYDQRQNALKWMLVTCFGYQGFKNARFGRIEAHEAINCFGRDRLLQAKEIAEEQGYEVLHALVDSIYLRKPGTALPEYQALAEQIGKATGLPISVEGIYRWIVFVPSKTSPRIGVPNRYFGLMEDGKLKIRGIEMRRHDCPALIADMQQEILEALRSASNAGEYRAVVASRGREILETYLTRLRDGKVEATDLAISSRLTQYPEQYAHATRAAIAAQSLQARGVRLRPGEAIEYILTDVGSKIPSERARPLQMLEGGLRYDRAEYERLLREAFRAFLADSPGGRF